MQCDAQSLVTAAQCLNCGIPVGIQNNIIIYLLCQIVNSGGGGGGGAAFLSGAGSPAGSVNSTVTGQTYLDTSSNNFWMSTATGTGGWVELIGS